MPLLPERMVIDLPAGAEVDQDLLNVLKELKLYGFQLALNEGAFTRDMAAALQLADILKLNITRMDRALLPGIVESLHKRRYQVLAQRVDTPEDFNFCKEVGFDFLQGFFLCQPEVVQGKSVVASRLVILELMHKLQDPRTDFRTLEEVLAQDVTLSYKLLRLANSGFYSTSVRINSIQQAISIIGLEQLRGWLILFLVSKTGQKPRELTMLSMIRARMCEMMARVAHFPHPDAYFLVGLFSLLDAMLDTSMPRILEMVNFSEEVVDALLNGGGSMGAALRCAQAYERGDWDNVSFFHLPPGDLRDIYLDSVQWMANATRNLEI
jgi:EAL and modified HD-GYP domain-containing signal transduction protein